MDELTPVPLRLANLADLPPDVARPGYARSDLRAGIVHIGVGNFHRAHMAVYLDRLFNQGLALDWAVTGAGVTAHDVRVRAALGGQDWLTTVVAQSATETQARVTGVMTGFVDPGDPAGLRRALADPAIRIVSLTVTEGGYFTTAAGAFNAEDPAIRADIAHPGDPRTAFGLILAALADRRAAGIAPFTVLSCDNLPHNGHAAAQAVIGLAERGAAGVGPDMADWLRAHVAFPNGMVDRIASVTTDRERGLCAGVHGVADAWPVFCEDWLQWVLEDDFPAGRPPLERAGVTFVSDVTAHETMKIRILNGGHAMIAYPAGLMDIHFVHDAMEDPLIRAFLARVTGDEVIPAVPPVPGVDLRDYAALVATRFANPRVGDTIRRLCFDGSNRQPKFIVPTVRDRLAQGARVDGLALASALWCRYCAGMSDGGQTIEPNDPDWAALTARAQAARVDPAAWLDMRAVYGATGQDPAFAGPFAAALAGLWRDGTRPTLAAWLAHGA